MSLEMSGKLVGKLLGISLIAAGIVPLSAQSVTETVKDSLRATPQDKTYFSLVHLRSDEMSGADRALLQSRAEEIRRSALVYGYDLGGGSWQVEQGVCPQLPDTLLLHYLERYPNGTQSLFTVLIPRTSGRVRVIPVLHRNAVPFLPSASNPKNYEIFNSLVTPEMAEKNSAPGGEWLSLGVCYAEMTGGKPHVPRDPSLDPATIKAPAPTVYLDPVARRRVISFPDRDADDVVKMWSVSLDLKGRVVAASNEDRSTYEAHAVQPAVEQSRLRPPAPERSANAAINPPVPGSKIAANPPGIDWKVVPSLPDPPSKIIANPPAPPSKIIPEPKQE
jgi:hypothetical protein